MNCPYCSAEMAVGIIEGDGRRAITWKARRECDSFKEKLEDFLNPYDEMLSDDRAFWKTHVDCYRCDECEKIIIDLKEKAKSSS